jgi:hypothetical protein
MSPRGGPLAWAIAMHAKCIQLYCVPTVDERETWTRKATWKLRDGVRHGRLQSVFLEPIVEVGLGRVVATSDKLLGARQQVCGNLL